VISRFRTPIPLSSTDWWIWYAKCEFDSSTKQVH
jgi:hypothetical protein